VVFDFGPGEILVLISLGLIFFGRKGDLGELLRSRLQRGSDATKRTWTGLEWLLFSGILILGTFVIALGATRH
jgi:hypothetical protein